MSPSEANRKDIGHRFYLTAGIAALGVDAMALAPVQPTSNQVALAPQHVVSNLAVELAAAVNPIQAWDDTLKQVLSAALFWIGIYAAGVIIAATAAFLLAEWLRVPSLPAPENPGLLSVVSGLLWPVIVIGVAQWGLIGVAQHVLRRAAPAVRPEAARGIRQGVAR